MLVKFHILYILPKLAVYTLAWLPYTAEFQNGAHLKGGHNRLAGFLMGSVESCARHMQTCAQKRSSHHS